MSDKQFDDLMRDAAANYRRPPEAPVNEMWAAIAEEAFGSDEGRGPRAEGREPRAESREPRLWGHQWMRMAAVLLLGIVVGRGSSMLTSRSTDIVPMVASGDSVSAAVRSPYNAVTDNYLGQTAALLISLPEELRSDRRDTSYVSRADHLLMQTRLLLDSPVAADPTLKSLFEDLEIVLAQVVRLPADRNSMEVDLLTQALERRDVLPRLRSAVADHIAD